MIGSLVWKLTKTVGTTFWFLVPSTQQQQRQMNEEAALPRPNDNYETRVRISVKWMGSNVAAFDFDLLFCIWNRHSVLQKASALQQLIVGAMGFKIESHELRVVLENGNVELTPNPGTGACFDSHTTRIEVKPWTPPPATTRAWKLLCATKHVFAENINIKQAPGKLERVPLLVSRYSKRAVLTHRLYYNFDDSRNGVIPRKIGQLVNIVVLNLKYHRLSGLIPTEVGKLINLTDLRLKGNKLTGSIPTELGKLIKLTALDLYANKLSGSIPTELGTLINMNMLNFSENCLIGSIPTELGALINMDELALTYNQLTGSIPTELGALINMDLLALAYNQLTGSIPTELGKLMKIQSLYLCNNKLTGPIPTDFGKFIHMKHLYLEDNNLHGLKEFKMYMNQQVPKCYVQV